MASLRTRNAEATRKAILKEARKLFAENGFDRTTVRTVANGVGVDAALVYRYFGSKQELFVEAVSLDLELPDLAVASREETVARLFAHFFKVWEDDPTFIGLLRASANNEEAADAMRSFFLGKVLPRLRTLVPGGSPERAAIAGSFIIGTAWARYLIKNPLLAEMPHKDFIEMASPALRTILFDE